MARLPEAPEIRVEMVSCSDFVRDYSDFRDGLLVTTQLAEVEGHLASCSSCRRYQRVVDGGIQELLSVPEIEPSDDFVARLQHRIYDLDAQNSSRGRQASGASFAAVVLVLTVIGAAAWFPVVREAAHTVELPPAVAAAPVDEVQTLTLFTPGPLLVPTSRPVRLVASTNSDLFSGYQLGEYMASRSAILPR